MALRTGQMATTAGAQKLVGPETRRRGLLIINHDTTIHVRLGPSTVATSGAATAGIQLRAGQQLSLVEGPFPQEEWWVIPESGTPTVSFAESLL